MCTCAEAIFSFFFPLPSLLSPAASPQSPSRIRLVNVGRPGGDLLMYAQCFYNWVPRPEDVDIFVIEMAPLGPYDSATAAEAESLIRTIRR